MDALSSNDSSDEQKLLQFSFQEVLASNPDTKSIFTLLKATSGERGILLCDHNPFPVDGASWKDMLQGSTLKLLAQNDKYGNFRLFLPKEFCDVKTTLIFPCNDYDIAKYREQKRFIVSETFEDYKNRVAPHLEDHKPSTAWVDKLLKHEAEADRIVFEDTDPLMGFVLAPDLKWDGLKMENFYAQAIVQRKDITCVRDLTSEHLPLLLYIRNKTYEAVRIKYGLNEHQIRAYIHYHPTFYHFHVHFTSASYNAPGSQVGKAILLDDVIRNIQMMPNFYQKATMTFILREGDPIFTVFSAMYPSLKPISKSD